MHVLFVHKNYPAQFGHIARRLVRQFGYQCTFVSERPPGIDGGVRRIQYKVRGGASKDTLFLARSFANESAHALAVFAACRRHLRASPDLVVGHSGFGSTLFLRELYDCPIVNYFEYYYRPRGSDLDFRPEFQVSELQYLRSPCRNAMILLDLQNCDAGYCPTAYQHGLFPEEYCRKLSVIFDGVDTSVWHRHQGLARRVEGKPVAEDTRIVTYVSRGLESMRGFDIFLKVARQIYRALPNVLFVVVGEDRVAYGGDLKYVGGKSFKEYALGLYDYDLSKFLFVSRMPPVRLAQLLSLSDLHVYLTVPFVLSWSLFDALACGCVVVASDTDPVRELIAHEKTGLLAPFYDVEGLAELALRALRDPPAHRHLGEAGMALVEEKYTLTRCLPPMLDLYRRAVARRHGATADPISRTRASYR